MFCCANMEVLSEGEAEKQMTKKTNVPVVDLCMRPSMKKFLNTNTRRFSEKSVDSGNHSCDDIGSISSNTGHVPGDKVSNAIAGNKDTRPCEDDMQWYESLGILTDHCRKAFKSTHINRMEIYTNDCGDDHFDEDSFNFGEIKSKKIKLTTEDSDSVSTSPSEKNDNVDGSTVSGDTEFPAIGNKQPSVFSTNETKGNEGLAKYFLQEDVYCKVAQELENFKKKDKMGTNFQKIRKIRNSKVEFYPRVGLERYHLRSREPSVIPIKNDPSLCRNVPRVAKNAVKNVYLNKSACHIAAKEKKKEATYCKFQFPSRKKKVNICHTALWSESILNMNMLKNEKACSIKSSTGKNMIKKKVLNNLPKTEQQRLLYGDKADKSCIDKGYSHCKSFITTRGLTVNEISTPTQPWETQDLEKSEHESTSSITDRTVKTSVKKVMYKNLSRYEQKSLRYTKKADKSCIKKARNHCKNLITHKGFTVNEMSTPTQPWEIQNFGKSEHENSKSVKDRRVKTSVKKTNFNKNLPRYEQRRLLCGKKSGKSCIRKDYNHCKTLITPKGLFINETSSSTQPSEFQNLGKSEYESYNSVKDTSVKKRSVEEMHFNNLPAKHEQKRLPNGEKTDKLCTENECNFSKCSITLKDNTVDNLNVTSKTNEIQFPEQDEIKSSDHVKVKSLDTTLGAKVIKRKKLQSVSEKVSLQEFILPKDKMVNILSASSKHSEVQNLENTEIESSENVRVNKEINKNLDDTFCFKDFKARYQALSEKASLQQYITPEHVTASNPRSPSQFSEQVRFAEKSGIKNSESIKERDTEKVSLNLYSIIGPLKVPDTFQGLEKSIAESEGKVMVAGTESDLYRVFYSEGHQESEEARENTSSSTSGQEELLKNERKSLPRTKRETELIGKPKQSEIYNVQYETILSVPDATAVEESVKLSLLDINSIPFSSTPSKNHSLFTLENSTNSFTESHRQIEHSLLDRSGKTTSDFRNQELNTAVQFSKEKHSVFQGDNENNPDLLGKERGSSDASEIRTANSTDVLESVIKLSDNIRNSDERQNFNSASLHSNYSDPGISQKLKKNTYASHHVDTYKKTSEELFRSQSIELDAIATSAILEFSDNPKQAFKRELRFWKRKYEKLAFANSDEDVAEKLEYCAHNLSVLQNVLSLSLQHDSFSKISDFYLNPAIPLCNKKDKSPYEETTPSLEFSQTQMTSSSPNKEQYTELDGVHQYHVTYPLNTDLSIPTLRYKLTSESKKSPTRDTPYEETTPSLEFSRTRKPASSANEEQSAELDGVHQYHVTDPLHSDMSMPTIGYELTNESKKSPTIDSPYEGTTPVLEFSWTQTTASSSNEEQSTELNGVDQYHVTDPLTPDLSIPNLRNELTEESKKSSSRDSSYQETTPSFEFPQRTTSSANKEQYAVLDGVHQNHVTDLFTTDLSMPNLRNELTEESKKSSSRDSSYQETTPSFEFPRTQRTTSSANKEQYAVLDGVHQNHVTDLFTTDLSMPNLRNELTEKSKKSSSRDSSYQETTPSFEFPRTQRTTSSANKEQYAVLDGVHQNHVTDLFTTDLSMPNLRNELTKKSKKSSSRDSSYQETTPSFEFPRTQRTTSSANKEQYAVLDGVHQNHVTDPFTTDLSMPKLRYELTKASRKSLSRDSEPRIPETAVSKYNTNVLRSSARMRNAYTSTSSPDTPSCSFSQDSFNESQLQTRLDHYSYQNKPPPILPVISNRQSTRVVPVNNKMSTNRIIRQSKLNAWNYSKNRLRNKYPHTASNRVPLSISSLPQLFYSQNASSSSTCDKPSATVSEALRETSLVDNQGPVLNTPCLNLVQNMNASSFQKSRTIVSKVAGNKSSNQDPVLNIPCLNSFENMNVANFQKRGNIVSNVAGNKGSPHFQNSMCLQNSGPPNVTIPFNEDPDFIKVKRNFVTRRERGPHTSSLTANSNSEDITEGGQIHDEQQLCLPSMEGVQQNFKSQYILPVGNLIQSTNLEQFNENVTAVETREEDTHSSLQSCDGIVIPIHNEDNDEDSSLQTDVTEHEIVTRRRDTPRKEEDTHSPLQSCDGIVIPINDKDIDEDSSLQTDVTEHEIVTRRRDTPCRDTPRKEEDTHSPLQSCDRIVIPINDADNDDDSSLQSDVTEHEIVTLSSDEEDDNNPSLPADRTEDEIEILSSYKEDDENHSQQTGHSPPILNLEQTPINLNCPIHQSTTQPITDKYIPRVFPGGFDPYIRRMRWIVKIIRNIPDRD